LITLMIGALMGLGLAAGGALVSAPVLADVTLNTSLTKTENAQGVRAHKLHIEWKDNGETILGGKVFALDGGVVVDPKAITDINVNVPSTLLPSGDPNPDTSPKFGVSGYALEADTPIVPSCQGSRTAILLVTDDIKAKLENFADNCLN
ncbi:hypothetical protein LCGC14_3016760, partial [marine sediment metagenome]